MSLLDFMRDMFDDYSQWTFSANGWSSWSFQTLVSTMTQIQAVEQNNLQKPKTNENYMQ